jgi:iron complex outermembrane receptor protein
MQMKKIVFIVCFIFFLQALKSQVIQGIIIDAVTGSPLAGANIIVKQENKGTVSVSDGSYQLTINNPGTYEIICSFIGYITIKKHVTISDSLVEVNFKLKPDIKKIDEIIIQGEITGPVKRTGDALYTGTALTSKGISLLGASANNSVYITLDIMPGIAVEAQDAYGLADKTVRIRGIKSNFSGMTIEGFPNYGIMPIGARDDIYDMENMQSVAVYKGATPSDLGTATGSKGGAIELQYKLPSDSFSVTIKQSAGTSNYFHSFARVDMGKLKTGSNAFASYSFTVADKWKGYGKLGPRHNISMGITQSIHKKINIELYGNYNAISRHSFKDLTYDEALDIENTFYDAYSENLTGIPEEDLNYYDYNKGNYTNSDLMGIFNYDISKNVKFVTKTYTSKENANYSLTGKKGPNVFMFNRERDINRMGLIPEIRGTATNTKYTIGYWFETSDNNALVYNSRIVEEGLNPVGYTYYTVNEKWGKIHSPYIKIAYTIKKFNIQAGLKYFYYSDPESERYTSVSPTEFSADPDPDLHTQTMEHEALLPSLGLGYDFSERLQAYINYGKNYMRPYCYMPVISLYVNNMEAFNENGMNLQGIFDTWEMETSDNIDLGIRYASKLLSASASVFYAKHHNVLASAYDPGVGLDYYQNIGELTASGAEMECYFRPLQHIMFFINPAYNSMTYNKNLVRGNEIIAIKGNQAPATPKISLKSGLFYSVNDFDISIMLKHVGKRYGDATNIEKIDPYTLADMGIKYFVNDLLFIKKIQIGIEVKNLFNTKYVGAINVSDDSNQGNAAYYAGISRNIVGSVSLMF